MKKFDGFEWAYRDFLTAMMIAFMAFAVIALVAAKPKPDPKAINAGDIVFQMGWDKKVDADMDLWVRAPGDTAVGFSHPGSVHCDLVRDDLGQSQDPQSRNLEYVLCRGIPDGEWVVNIVLYSYQGQYAINPPYPIGAKAEATLIADGMHVIATQEVDLGHPGQEVTAFRFRTQGGKLVPDSIDRLPATLWGGRKP